jgi:hypothetical protein
VVNLYVCTNAYSFNTRSNYDSKLEDNVYIISEIYQVHSLSNCAFRSAVNAREVRVTPVLPYKEQCQLIAILYSSVGRALDWSTEGWGFKSQHVPSTFVAKNYLTYRHFTDKRSGFTNNIFSALLHIHIHI